MVAVVVTLDGVVHDAGQPLVGADDPMLTRGEGVFESTLVRAGRVCLLDAHLARLAASARLAGLPDPQVPRWRAAVATAVARWEGDEAVLRLVCGRGVAFVTVSPVPERALTARRDGVAAVTLAAGRRDGMAGAKSVSYALNAAALREAARRGAQDAVFVDGDGYVLEGPRSSVVIADGDTLCSPPPSLPLLPGTTQRALFDIAPNHRYSLLRVSDLYAAQGVWLLSGITLAARVHTLDGVALAPSPFAATLTTLVEEAVLRDR